jgi:hypothetical protein
MPSTSRRQANFMAMCAKGDPKRRRKKKCPSQKVAREFHRADRAKKKRGKR